MVEAVGPKLTLCSSTCLLGRPLACKHGEGQLRSLCELARSSRTTGLVVLMKSDISLFPCPTLEMKHRRFRVESDLYISTKTHGWVLDSLAPL